MIIGSLNSSSFELDDNTDYRTESIFDKVYLMSDFSEKIIEIKRVGKNAQIVWQWSLWDHLVQSKYPNKLHYGSIAEHPELVDPQ